MTHNQAIMIAGAGIMGLLTAHMLKKRDPEALVVLTDGAGFPSKNASYMAGGMLAPYSEIEHLPKAFLPAALSGLNFWKDLSKDNLDIGFRQSGSLIVSHPADRHILQRFENLLQTNDLPYKNFNKSDLHQSESSMLPNFDEALFIEEEAHLNPQEAMQALIDLQTVKVAENFDMKQQAEYSWIIDCRGMAANDPELRGVKGETLIVYNPDFHLKRPLRLMHPRYPLYIVPRGNGLFMIGATVIESAENQNVSLRSAMELMSALHVISPSFADASIIEIKAGIRPAYPDNLPRIKIDAASKTISCNGLFRHGYLLAPVIAECVTDHIAGKENEFMHLFRKQDNESHHQRAA